MVFPAERDLSNMVAFNSHCHLSCCHSLPPRCVKSLTTSCSTGDIHCLLTAELAVQSTWMGNPVVVEYVMSFTCHLSKTLVEVWERWVYFNLWKQIHKSSSYWRENSKFQLIYLDCYIFFIIVFYFSLFLRSLKRRFLSIQKLWFKLGDWEQRY